MSASASCRWHLPRTAYRESERMVRRAGLRLRRPARGAPGAPAARPAPPGTGSARRRPAPRPRRSGWPGAAPAGRCGPARARAGAGSPWCAALALVAARPARGRWRAGSTCDSSTTTSARTDPFSEITGGRPRRRSDGALNILLVGTDSRDPDAAARPGRQVARRHDHRDAHPGQPRQGVPGLASRATSTCRAAESAEAGAANAERGKINARLRVRRAAADRADRRVLHRRPDGPRDGDRLRRLQGGHRRARRRRPATSSGPITSIHKPFRTFQKGLNHMNGAEALDWIRQRKQFPDGDFARMRHQQEFLRALHGQGGQHRHADQPRQAQRLPQRGHQRGHRRPGLLAGRHGAAVPQPARREPQVPDQPATAAPTPSAASRWWSPTRRRRWPCTRRCPSDKMAEWVAANRGTEGQEADGDSPRTFRVSVSKLRDISNFS